MKEVWKEFTPKYEVSNLGRVRRTDKLKRLVTPHFDRAGYLRVKIRGKSPQPIHRLVALAFMENPENKPHVHHKNSIRYDNRAENLQWTTAEENVSYINRGLDTEDINRIRLLLNGKSRKEICHILGISLKTLYNYCNKYDIVKARKPLPPIIPKYFNEFRRQRYDEIKNRVLEGQNFNTIASELGISIKAVYNYRRLIL